jgi:hypothetical protein
MLRDNLGDSFYRCLENPRPAGAELSLTENVTSPVPAEPRQFNPSAHPDMKATGSDLQWAFGPELKAGMKGFTVGQREGLNWLTGNNRGNRKWWEGYTSRNTNQ